MDNKKWWSSTAIWGSIIGAMAYGLQILGVTSISVEEQQPLTQHIANIVTSFAILAGIIMTVIGRWRAKKPISNQIVPGKEVK